VTIRTVDGQSLDTEANVAIPATDLDAQWQRLAEKFHTLAEPVLGARPASIGSRIAAADCPRAARRLPCGSAPPPRPWHPDGDRHVSDDPDDDFRSARCCGAKATSYEDMTVGRVFEHHWGRTISDGDNAAFTTQTLSFCPLYFNEPYARSMGHRTIQVNPLLVFNTVFGLSVQDLSEAAGRSSASTAASFCTRSTWATPSRPAAR
jgi:acyl dehydratase